jgi:hypothetical protein
VLSANLQKNVDKNFTDSKESDLNIKIDSLEKRKKQQLEKANKMIECNFEFCNLFAQSCLLIYESLGLKKSTGIDNKIVRDVTNLYLSTVTSNNSTESILSKIKTLCDESVYYCENFEQGNFNKRLVDEASINYKLEMSIAQMVVSDIDNLKKEWNIFTSPEPRLEIEIVKKLTMNSDKNFIV